MHPAPAAPWRPAVLAGYALLLVLAACGPSEGDRCNSTQFACDDDASALECRDSVWVRIPCRGAGGCKVEGGKVQCDMTLNQPGDLCPLTAENQATCKTPELNAVLECHDGVLLQTATCSSCFSSGNLIVCQP